MPAHLKHTITDRINAAAKRYQGVPDPMSIPAIRNELINLYALGSVTMAAHTILFSSEQAEVFAGLAEGYTESLEYALPFEQVLLEFTEPVPWGDRQLLGIALSHDEYDQAEFESFAAERNMIIEQPAQQRIWGKFAVFRENWGLTDSVFRDKLKSRTATEPDEKSEANLP